MAVRQDMSLAELSALCSNLEKACNKQLQAEAAGLFDELASYYGQKSQVTGQHKMSDLDASVQQDLKTHFPQAKQTASAVHDRGALRALTWSEKVTRILGSVMMRYEKQQAKLLEDKQVFVCDICGFIYIGDNAPDICPICKVPNRKITAIEKGVL